MVLFVEGMQGWTVIMVKDLTDRIKYTLIILSPRCPDAEYCNLCVRTAVNN